LYPILHEIDSLEIPPETACITTTGAGTPATICFLSPQIEQNLFPSWWRLWTNSEKEQNVASVRFGNVAKPIAGAASCVLMFDSQVGR